MPVVALASMTASPARFGPGEALDLAVLGTAGQGAIDADDLVAAVAALGGPLWRPCGGSVLRSLEGLMRKGYVGAESGRTVHPLIVRTTEAGLAHLRKLLRAPPVSDCDPMAHTALVLKIAFLDFLPRPEQCVCLDRLIQDLERSLLALQAEDRRSAGSARHLRLAYRRPQERIAEDLAWLWSIRSGLT